VTISSREFELLVHRCLAAGVPSGVVAQVFELEPELVAEARKHVLVTEYGTADQEEYRQQLEWKTLQKCQLIMDSGSPADQARIATQVLGRQIAKGGKMESESNRQARERLEEQLTRMRESPAAVGAPSRFVLGPAVPDGG
jgi:hypothetical protein